MVQIHNICRRQNKCKLKAEFLLGLVENWGKGENAVYPHFLRFPQCFQKASFAGLLKVGKDKTHCPLLPIGENVGSYNCRFSLHSAC